MGGMHDGHTRRFETVEPTDPVRRCEHVDASDQIEKGHRDPVDCRRDTANKRELDVRRLGRRLARRDEPPPDLQVGGGRRNRDRVQPRVKRMNCGRHAPVVGSASVRHGRRLLDRRHLDELLSHRHAAERFDRGLAARVQRAGAERGHGELRRKRRRHVEDMGARRAGGERAVAKRFEHAALPEIERQRDDFGAIAVRQPWNRVGGIEAPRICQENALHSAV